MAATVAAIFWPFTACALHMLQSTTRRHSRFQRFTQAEKQPKEVESSCAPLGGRLGADLGGSDRESHCDRTT